MIQNIWKQSYTSACRLFSSLCFKSASCSVGALYKVLGGGFDFWSLGILEYIWNIHNSEHQNILFSQPF